MICVEKTEYLFDPLQMYFEEDHRVTDNIIIYQPTVGDIVTFGEEKLNQVLLPFVTNPTSMRAILWQQGIDWTKITDYDLFCQLILQIHPQPEETSIIFGDLDFSKFIPYERQHEDGTEQNVDIVLWDNEKEILIDESIYNHISCYLRTMFNAFPKVEKAKDKTTKQWMIEEDLEKSVQKPQHHSNLLSMISFCLNHPGFKYKKSELRDMGICEFYDSVQRLLIYESTNSLMKGMYSGFVDTSKIEQKEFNFMRDTDILKYAK